MSLRPPTTHRLILSLPRYSLKAMTELGLMLDIGRKYFAPRQVLRLVDRMAELGFNLLHLHFSENERFAFESKVLGLQAKPKRIWSRHAVMDVVGEAKSKGVEVMGEIGMPGHMGAILKQYPVLRLCDENGRPFPNALDLSNPDSLSLCRALIEEFAPLFTSTNWHLGADEYLPPQAMQNNPTLKAYAQDLFGELANPMDAKLYFLNTLGETLHALGLRPRVWGDQVQGGACQKLDLSFVVDWWSASSPLHPGLKQADAIALAEQGHYLVNCSWTPCYFVVHPQKILADGFLSRPDVWENRDTWQPHHFQGAIHDPVESLPEAYSAQLQGVKMQVWCDQPDYLSSDEILQAIHPQMAWLAKRVRSRLHVS